MKNKRAHACGVGGADSSVNHRVDMGKDDVPAVSVSCLPTDTVPLRPSTVTPEPNGGIPPAVSGPRKYTCP